MFKVMISDLDKLKDWFLSDKSLLLKYVIFLVFLYLLFVIFTEGLGFFGINFSSNVDTSGSGCAYGSKYCD